MRRAFLVSLALAAAAASPALAETFSFAGQEVVLDTPKGYCRLDPGNAVDAAYIGAMEKMQEGRNHIVFMFASCDGLTAARAGKVDQLADSGAVMIVMNGSSIVAVPGMTRAQFVDEASRQVATADTAGLRDELRKRTEQAGLGVELSGMKVLGVLKKDELGLYIGFLLPSGAGANAQSVMSINAITLVNSLPISVVIGRPVLKEGVADELLAIELSTVKRLIDANAAIEAAAPAPESFWGGVLQSALIGGITAGLAGAVIAFIQRRRTKSSGGGPSA